MHVWHASLSSRTHFHPSGVEKASVSLLMRLSIVVLTLTSSSVVVLHIIPNRMLASGDSKKSWLRISLAATFVVGGGGASDSAVVVAADSVVGVVVSGGAFFLFLRLLVV